MPHELVRLRIHEISAVDRPANRRRFLVVKRDGPPAAKADQSMWRGLMQRMGKAMGWTPEQIERAEQEAQTFDDMIARRRIGHVVSALYDHHGALMDTLSSIANSDDGGTPELVKGAISDYLDSLKGALGTLIRDAFKKAENGDKPLLKFDASAAIERLVSVEDTMEKPTKFDLTKVSEDSRPMVEAEIARLQTQVADLQKAQKPAEPPKPEDVLKSAPEEVRKAVADLQARVEKAETEAKDARKTADDERGARERAERIAKSKTEFSGIAVDHEKLGDALHKLEGHVEKEVVETIQGVLKAASDQVKTSKLFAENGHGAPPAPDSAEGKIAKRAGELMTANPKLTKVEAEVKALEEHPEWYEQQLVEQAG